MAQPKVEDGVWIRPVPWTPEEGWRTDMTFNVFCRCDIQGARYELEGGPTVVVPFQELRRALLWGPISLDKEKLGPHNIDPDAQEVNGRRVTMLIHVSEADQKRIIDLRPKV